MTERLTDHDWEALSAFLDGVYTPEEKRQVELRLAADADFLAAYRSLLKTRGILRAVPNVKRRRNFFINAAMVRPSGWLWVIPIVNFSSVAAGILAVLFFVADLLPIGVRSISMAPLMENAPAVQATYAQPAVAVPAEAVEVQKNALEENAQADQAFIAPMAAPPEPYAQEGAGAGQPLAGDTSAAVQPPEELPGILAAAPPAPVPEVPQPMLKAEEETAVESSAAIPLPTGEGSEGQPVGVMPTAFPTQAPLAKAGPIATETISPTLVDTVGQTALPTETAMALMETEGSRSAIAVSPTVEKPTVVIAVPDVQTITQPETKESIRTNFPFSIVGGYLLLLSILLSSAVFILKRRLRQ